MPVDRNGMPAQMVGQGALTGVFFIGFDIRQPGGLLRTIAAQAREVSQLLTAGLPRATAA